MGIYSDGGFDMNIVNNPNYNKTQEMMLDAYVRDYVPMINRSIDGQGLWPVFV